MPGNASHAAAHCRAYSLARAGATGAPSGGTGRGLARRARPRASARVATARRAPWPAGPRTLLAAFLELAGALDLLAHAIVGRVERERLLPSLERGRLVTRLEIGLAEVVVDD